MHVGASLGLSLVSLSRFSLSIMPPAADLVCPQYFRFRCTLALYKLCFRTPPSTGLPGSQARMPRLPAHALSRARTCARSLRSDFTPAIPHNTHAAAGPARTSARLVVVTTRSDTHTHAHSTLQATRSPGIARHTHTYARMRHGALSRYTTLAEGINLAPLRSARPGRVAPGVDNRITLSLAPGCRRARWVRGGASCSSGRRRGRPPWRGI